MGAAFLFGDRLSWAPGWLQIHNVPKCNLELWFRCFYLTSVRTSPHPVTVMLIEIRALHRLSNHTANWATPQPWDRYFLGSKSALLMGWGQGKWKSCEECHLKTSIWPSHGPLVALGVKPINLFDASAPQMIRSVTRLNTKSLEPSWKWAPPQIHLASYQLVSGLCPGQSCQE